MRDRHVGATIEIADGSIAGISNTQVAPSSEFAGCFALPGLVDMHVHLPPDNALKLTQGAALLYLLHGITSIREAGDLDGTAVAAAQRLSREGAHPVPRVFYCGPFVGAGKATFKNTILLKDASEAAADAAAIRVKATGASFMKFYEGLTEPMIRALEQACARHGLKMMGHVPAGITYEEARIAEVQHFFGVPEPRTLERNALINRSCDWHAVDERADGQNCRSDGPARHRQHTNHCHQSKDALLPGFRSVTPAIRSAGNPPVLSRRDLAPRACPPE